MVSFKKYCYVLYKRYLEVGGDPEKAEMTVSEIAHIIGKGNTTEGAVRTSLDYGIKWRITKKRADKHSPGQRRYWSLTEKGINYCKRLDVYYDYETDTVIESLKQSIK